MISGRRTDPCDDTSGGKAGSGVGGRMQHDVGPADRQHPGPRVLVLA